MKSSWNLESSRIPFFQRVNIQKTHPKSTCSECSDELPFFPGFSQVSSPSSSSRARLCACRCFCCCTESKVSEMLSSWASQSMTCHGKIHDFNMNGEIDCVYMCFVSSLSIWIYLSISESIWIYLNLSIYLSPSIYLSIYLCICKKYIYIQYMMFAYVVSLFVIG